MDIFQSNIQKYNTTLLNLASASNRLSVMRLAVFLFAVIVIVILANERLFALMIVTIGLSGIGFALLIKRHNEVDYRKRYTTFLKEINEQENLKLENKLSVFPTGEDFVNRHHPYVSDMDIFGQHSIFQLINRITTDAGHSLLAQWLSAPASKKVILERQQAVKELSPTLAWRQNFQAAGMDFKHTNNDYAELQAWIKKPVQLLGRQSKYLLAIVPLSLASTWALVYFFSEFLYRGNPAGIAPLAICFLINTLLLQRVRPLAEEILENVSHNIRILHGYESLIIRIESEKFHSTILQQLQSVLNNNNSSAAHRIRKLRKILEVFQLRGRKRQFNHQFYSIFNNLWFLDFYLIILTEKWKHVSAASLTVWASAVNEFEVLGSIAGFHYSNPSFTFPEIVEDPYLIHFEGLGHPLIGSANRVCNDFTLSRRGEIAMITGSNMAGKSTFLRAVGVNVVLALMGAPCCATSGRVSNIQLFSSMRTQDNLHEGVSSFYAELKRVEHLLALIASGREIFFLLDEVFKGTNSKDRHKGGFSLIRQLQELNTFGMISTHDLELAGLSHEDSAVVNYSFNSKIQDGKMFFNYKLTDGLCTDFNASELMKNSGIKILE